MPNLNLLGLINLSEVSEYSLNDNSLQTIVSNSRNNCIVILPGYDIRIVSLNIQHSIHLKGSPGNKLYINGGTISIHANSNSELLNLKLSEMLIKYTIDSASASFTSSYNLISISPGNTELEFNDCLFESMVNFDDVSIQELNCISISSSDNELVKYEERTNILKMNNCIIRGFSTGIKGGANYYCILDKLHIEKCRNDGISLKYPLFFSINKSIIENNQGRGVIIKLSNDNTKHSTPRSSCNSGVSSQNDSIQSIFIQENTFTGNKKCAIEIFCKTTSKIFNKIQIKDNKILENTREGISLKHLIVNSLEILDNAIMNNEGSGI